MEKKTNERKEKRKEREQKQDTEIKVITPN